MCLKPIDMFRIEVGFSLVLRARSLVGPGTLRAPRMVATSAWRSGARLIDFDDEGSARRCVTKLWRKAHGSTVSTLRRSGCTQGCRGGVRALRIDPGASRSAQFSHDDERFVEPGRVAELAQLHARRHGGDGCLLETGMAYFGRRL